ncbi:hypothetical protein [Nocardioides sp.]|uniref:divisome protein SepX/GlpR n=1 Tax=Nocardioides sp. TaxID=35761 RepID=UPI002610937C|nr:hypothetical protein [Nocardioides sp.]
MDLSPLIFVALAVAWAVYLVPQALRHHDEVVRSRSVDRFSHTMRVLARREPVSRSSSRLVVTPGRVPSAPVVTTKASAAPTVDATAAAAEVPPVPAPVRREAARRAARRRRRVLSVLLLLLALTGGLVAARLLAWPVLLLPVSLLVAWLVACRLMVRRERGISGPLARIPATVLPEAAPAFAAGATGEETQEVAVVSAPLAEEAVSGVLPAPAAEGHQEPVDVPTPRAPAAAAGLWEPVPVTLPTYVSKPAAERRSVRTIDLDATGVWTSGRSDADSALVRDAEERARRAEGEAPGRAVGS